MHFPTWIKCPLILIILLFCGQIWAGLDDLIPSTCRIEMPVVNKQVIYGTGFVFKEDGSDYYIMTAGHVTKSEQKDGLYIRFFHGIKDSPAMAALTIKQIYIPNTIEDLAVIKLSKTMLKDYPKPAIIKIADNSINKGNFYTYGCPTNGNYWPSGYRGYFINNTEIAGQLGLYPCPDHGQSGSPIEVSGQIVGMLINTDKENNIGGAAPLWKIQEILNRWQIQYQN